MERFQGERGRQEVAAAAIPYDEGVGAGHFARALLGMDIDSAGLVFDEVILQCKNFKCTGCVLAWMTIRGRSVPDLLLDALGFPKGIHQMLAAKTKEIAPRKKGALASMDMSAALEISEHEGTKPFLVDPVQAVPMRRPRYCWILETLDGIFNDVHCTAGKYWVEVSAMAPYPESNQWLTEGYWWNGDGLDVAFPTCVKSIPRSRPPPKPAGLAKCSADCISRWEADNYRFPPYQYDWKYLIMSETKWRLINADERELLLGYGHHHTRLAMSASEVKSSATAFEDKRLSMLGDSFSIYSFVIFAVACSKNFLPAMSYKHLVQRMGLAPGFKGQLRMQAPLRKQLRYGTPIRILEKYPKTVSDFNRFLLRRTNHTGSDVRIATGDVLAPKQYPRQSVSSQWWNWEEAFTTKWQKKEHINILELRAILLSLQYQTSRHKIHNARVFHISDSYICISIVSKGRSGSRLLGQVLKKISAHCLAFGLYVVLAHVDSLDNPTDEGSRR